MPKQKNIKVPKELKEHYQATIKITNEFCQKYLNDEYAKLCCEMAVLLARKRPSPLFYGHINTWAAGIIYTIGSHNYLFDKSQHPYMPMQNVCEKLGIPKSTVSQKSATIRHLLKINHFDSMWALSSRIKDSDMFWIIQINGIFIDVRTCPREIQEIAYKKGLTPYIPEDNNLRPL